MRDGEQGQARVAGSQGREPEDQDKHGHRGRARQVAAGVEEERPRNELHRCDNSGAESDAREDSRAGSEADPAEEHERS